ncbi:MAG: cell wall hydrolase [Erythrobacter sp.]
MLAIIGVPAMAASDDFGVFSAPRPAAPAADPLELAAARALAFERPGMSFPGSAFFFLEDPPGDALIALPASDPLVRGGEAGREAGAFIPASPAARPFFAGGGVSWLRAQHCLAQAVWYEAANESEAGQRAVAQVVLNRVAHPAWPASVCGVVYQGSDRQTGCQFTFTCDGSLRRSAGGASWACAQAIAAEALSGRVYAPVSHATHYHTLWVHPYWASSLDHVGTIGAHRFYRHRGSSGEQAAFTMRYSGIEPAISERPGAPAEPPAPMALPVQAAPALLADHDHKLPGTSTSAAASKAGAPDTRRSGEVRREFSNAGQWRADPRRPSASKSPSETAPPASH